MISGFIGTWLGTALLEKLPEAAFKVILKWLLTILSLDLLRRAAGFLRPMGRLRPTIRAPAF